MINILHSIGYGFLAWLISMVVLCLFCTWLCETQEQDARMVKKISIVIGIITFCLTLK